MLRAVAAGTYRVVLTVDGKEYTTTVRIENDPNAPGRNLTNEEAEPIDPDMTRQDD